MGHRISRIILISFYSSRFLEQFRRLPGYNSLRVSWEDRSKEEEMTAPLTLPSLDEPTRVELRCRYEESTDAETRTRYQMLLLSLRGQTSSQIAQTVLRSQDTVVRVLKRYFTGGLDAVPRRTAPGRERRVTAAWEAERLASDRAGSPCCGTGQRQLDHRAASQRPWASTRAWRLTEETVRVYLHAHGYVCKRPTWTLRRKAETQAHYVGNARIGRGALSRCHSTRTSTRA